MSSILTPDPPEPAEPGYSEQLVRALVQLPKIVFIFVFGFVVMVLIDMDMMAVAISAVLLGLAVHSVYWGLFFFFIYWTLLRKLGLLNMVGQAIQNVANNLVYHANRIRSPQVSDE